MNTALVERSSEEQFSVGVKKYMIGQKLGPLEIVAETMHKNRNAVVLSCSICGKTRVVGRQQLTRIAAIAQPDVCTCSRSKNVPGPLVQEVPERRRTGGQKPTKFAAGTIHGIYEILENNKSVLTLRCAACGRILEGVKLNNFWAWSHNRCTCELKKYSTTVAPQPEKAEVHSIVRNSKSLSDGGFDNKIFVKASLQRDDMYGAISRHGIFSSSLVLAGPDIERHIKDIRSSFGAKGDLINIVENNPQVLASQLERYSKLDDSWVDISNRSHNIKSGVAITYCDIAQLPPHTVIDADLMGTYKTDGDTIISLLSKQAKTMKNGGAFIFTLSERVGNGEPGYEKTTQWIQQEVFPILGMKAKCVNKVSIIPAREWMYKHKILISVEDFGRVIDVSMFHYADQKGPMITCCLVYK